MKHSQDLKLNWHLVYITTAWLGLGKVRVPWPSTPQPRRSTPHQVLWVTLDIVCGRKCLTTVIARYVILNWLPFLNHHSRPYYLEHESQNWQQFKFWISYMSFYCTWETPAKRWAQQQLMSHSAPPEAAVFKHLTTGGASYATNGFPSVPTTLSSSSW